MLGRAAVLGSVSMSWWRGVVVPLPRRDGVGEISVAKGSLAAVRGTVWEVARIDIVGVGWPEGPLRLSVGVVGVLVKLGVE